MPITERSPSGLVIQTGHTTLTLDLSSSSARLQRKLLFWTLKAKEVRLDDIREVKVDAAVDRASGVTVFSVVLVMASGAAWALPADTKGEADTYVDAIKTVLS